MGGSNQIIDSPFALNRGQVVLRIQVKAECGKNVNNKVNLKNDWGSGGRGSNDESVKKIDSASQHQ